jgi:hypothetical protein
MAENKFGQLARLFAKKGNTDHPDMEHVDEVAAEFGVDRFTGRQVFLPGETSGL